MFFWSTFFFDLYEIVTFESGGHCWNPPGLKRKETKKQAKQFVWKLGSSGVNPQLIRAKAGDQSRPISISLKKKKKSIQVGINPLFMENHQQIRVWTKLERERENHTRGMESRVSLCGVGCNIITRRICVCILQARDSLFRREQDGASKRRAVCCHERHVRRPVRDPARWQKRKKQHFFVPPKCNNIARLTNFPLYK